MFDSNFLGKVSAILNDRCVNGGTVSRTEICRLLNLDSSWDATIGALVRQSVIPGFELRKGLHGGIGRVGEKPVRTKATKAPKSSQFDEEFLAQLREACDMLCVEGVYIPRHLLALTMKSPGSKTENLISLAIKSGSVPGYASSAGRGRGVYRLSSVGSEGASEETPPSLDTLPAPAPETDMEAAPEAPKPRKRARKAQAEETV